MNSASGFEPRVLPSHVPYWVCTYSTVYHRRRRRLWKIIFDNFDLFRPFLTIMKPIAAKLNDPWRNRKRGVPTTPGSPESIVLDNL
jgi:hypothetical protein